MTTDTKMTSLESPVGPPLAPVSLVPMSSGLSDDDQLTLRRALSVIKAARADTKNADLEIAGRARLRLAIALCYLIGFLDGTGYIKPNLNPGFESLFASKLPVDDPEAQLDELLKQLEETLSGPSTRILPLILIGIGVAAGVGAICKLVAANID